MVAMFETIERRGEEEPDTDLIGDILEEQFPDITIEDLAKAVEIVGRLGRERKKR
jgi:hypothetical protein